MKETHMEHTLEEINRRIQGIAASAAFEDMESTEDDIEMLRKLGTHEISETEYNMYYGLVPKGSDNP